MEQALSIGEAKKSLQQWRDGAQSLLGKLRVLNPNGIVMDTGVASGPIVSLPMTRCGQTESDHLTVADFVTGMEGLIKWLDDLVECLDAPDGRAFAEGELSD